jgi:hypothetical protein
MKNDFITVDKVVLSVAALKLLQQPKQQQQQ